MDETELEKTLAARLELFEFLVELDLESRRLALSSECPFKDPVARFDSIERLLGLWLEAAGPLERAIEERQRVKRFVARAEEFTRRCEEARWMLADSIEKLIDGGFVELRDRAIDDLRSGNVLPGLVDET